MVLLMKNKLKSGADGILIFLVSCIATHLVIKFIIFNFINDEHVRLQMNTFLGLCYGPLIYLYARKLYRPEFAPFTRWYVFIPFILATIAYFSVASVLIVAPAKGYGILNWYNNFTFYAIITSDVFYTCLSLKLAALTDKKQFREIRLLRQIAYAFLFMSFVAVCSYILNLLGYQVNILVRTISYSVFLLLCVVILRHRFLILQHASGPQINAITKEPEAITGTKQSVAIPETHIVDEGVPEVKKSILTKEEQQHVWHQLEAQMKTSKVFKDGTLSLDKLVTLTGINKYHISETLNDYAGKSFYQYINEYRVEFAIAQMKYKKKFR
jgi:AraC-like DNA-binding protein